MKQNEYAEPTEMAGVAEAETEAAYAWALDYDDADEFPTLPTQRLTSRRITSAGRRGQPGGDRGSRCDGARGAVT